MSTATRISIRQNYPLWLNLVLLLILLVAPPPPFAVKVNAQEAAVVAEACTYTEVLDDSCPTRVDLNCDAGGACDPNSDCFDCDPCRAYDSTTCQACTAAGCHACTSNTGALFCSSPAYAAASPHFCSAGGGTPFRAACGDDDDDGDGTDDNTNANPNFVCTSGDLQNDAEVCEHAFDFVCDSADGVRCPTGSDCFDCDPFLQLYRDSGCAACVASGGTYCVTGLGQPVCSDPDLVASSSSSSLEVCVRIEGGTEYVTICPDEDDVTHPLNNACDTTRDTCPYQFNGVCDAGDRCEEGSDCFDCSPCQQHRFEGCEACTAAGCLWCEADATCFPRLMSFGISSGAFQCTKDDFLDTCPKNDDNKLFSDPLFGAMDWVYEMINVKPAWEQGITGAGIGIRINDDGVDASHPDLSANFDVDSSCTNYLPLAQNITYSHGTACAALAAAGRNNDACAVGIAPDASISSCRVFNQEFKFDPDVIFRYLFLYQNQENVHVSSNSFGDDACYRIRSGSRRLQTGECPFSQTNDNSPCGEQSACSGIDWGDTALSSSCELDIISYCRSSYETDYDACISFLDLFVDCEYNSQNSDEQAAILEGITSGRGGLGIIYMYAAGNEYAIGEDINFEGSLNSRFTISVGAVGKDRLHATYSTTGAALFVTAPGGDIESYTGMLVALPGGGCHDATFGTSYATPVAAGAVALILQANLKLSWRDVQGILATTSQMFDEDDSSWTTNAAGVSHSYKYGFGVIDVGAAVAAAESWDHYSTEVELVAESGSIDLAIREHADGEGESSVTITASETFETESVVVYLDLSHSSRGDLELVLVSPSGTESILHPGQRPENQQGVRQWMLMTVRNWGEPASGEWTLRIVDESPGDVSECVDLPWSITFAQEVIDCQFLVLSKSCEDGGQGSNFPEYFGGVSDLSAIAFVNGDRVSPIDACCECGGGSSAALIDDLLRSWRLVVYGHDVLESSPVSPSIPTMDQETNSPITPPFSGSNVGSEMGVPVANAPTAGTATTASPVSSPAGLLPSSASIAVRKTTAAIAIVMLLWVGFFSFS